MGEKYRLVVIQQRSLDDVLSKNHMLAYQDPSKLAK
jgi:hypothetical protein